MPNGIFFCKKKDDKKKMIKKDDKNNEKNNEYNNKIFWINYYKKHVKNFMK